MTEARINGQLTVVSDDFFDLPPSQQNLQARRLARRQTQSQKPEVMMNDINKFGEYLERQDVKENISDNSALHDFALSAGVGINKFAMGVGDLVGYGPSPQKARELENYDNALADQSPKANFAGRMVGGAAAAAPLAMAAGATFPEAALGMVGRGIVSGASGLLEGAAELPFSDESRVGNGTLGALSGVVSEPLISGLQQTIKRIPFGALVDKSVGFSETIRDKASGFMRDAGYEYSSLKPSTRHILESIGRADDVDNAVKNAIANEQGFKLTAGEFSGDFDQIGREQDAIRGSQEAGDIMREFKDEQNIDITNASGVLAESAGGNIQNNNEQVGTVLKTALESSRSRDKSAVSAAYDAAEQLQLENNIDMPLDQKVVSDAFYEMANEHVGTHGGLLKDIGRELARYDILDPEEFATDMPFTMPDGDSGSLGVANTEKFIKFLNSKYSQGDNVGNAILADLKQVIGANADDVIARGLDDADAPMAKKFISQARQARAMNKQYYDLWEAKDVLQDLTGTKINSTETPVKSASDMVKRITRSPEDARSVISQLESSGNGAAVSDLRTHVLKDLFDKSLNPNVDANADFFSGSKLSTQIKRSSDLLQAVLSPGQFQSLKAFEVQVAKATKPPAGTVNHSNTATKLLEAVVNIMGSLPRVAAAGKLDGLGATRTMKEAVSTKKRTGMDHILKLDGNHIKLNAGLRQAIEQISFEDDSALSEEKADKPKRGALAE